MIAPRYAALIKRVAAEFWPGEEALWAGPAGTGAFIQRYVLALVSFLILGPTFLLVWHSADRALLMNILRALGIGWVLTGIGIILASGTIWGLWYARRTVYIVTTHRVFGVTGGEQNWVGRKGLTKLEVREHANGTGDLILRRNRSGLEVIELPERFDDQVIVDPLRSGDANIGVDDLVLTGIPDVRHVAQIIIDAYGLKTVGDEHAA